MILLITVLRVSHHNKYGTCAPWADPLSAHSAPLSLSVERLCAGPKSPPRTSPTSTTSAPSPCRRAASAMAAKQQDALFRRALSLHQTGSPTSSLRQALSLYTEAIALGSPTLPLQFNSAAVCFSLSALSSSPAEAASFHTAAAGHLDAALGLAPTNLEALVARAAVEDAQARAKANPGEIRGHRDAACAFLRGGIQAEPGDAQVRILLAVRSCIFPQLGSFRFRTTYQPLPPEPKS